jgi:SAM-dependent methyltransferase
VLFDTVAELYDELRPGYPEALADDVLSIAGVTSEGRILEIGAGSGQATRLFASRGYSVTSIELGANMAALARENLKAFPNTEILNLNFEDWPVEIGAFDVVISGSAFHWIPPEIGYAKCALALKQGGHLALFWNGDPKPTGGVYDALQSAYERWAPEMTNRTQSNHPHGRHEDRVEAFTASGCFGAPVCREYAWSRTLTSEDYARLCCTYSDHIALPDEQRADLCKGIREAIDAHGGTIERQYLTRLYLAVKI